MKAMATRAVRPDRLRAAQICWLLPSLAVTAWWLSRPYIGFGHDARYYAADVLRRIGDNALNRDLFFGRGTQGEYSVYPWAYAFMTRWWGLVHAAFAMTLIARLAWLAALTTLCRTVQSGEKSITAFVLLLLLPVYYESHKILSYGEPFETPRHWAEAAVMLSLAAAIRSRFLMSLMLAVAACAIHPLMGLPGLTAAVLLLPPWPKKAALLVGVTAISLLVALQVGPMAQLFHAYDHDWYAIVQTHNPMVLVSEWDADSLAKTLMWVFLLGTVAWSAPTGSGAKRLAHAMFWTSGAFIAIWIAGSLARNVLIIQLQFFRVLWLTQLVAPGVLLSLIPPKESWRAGDRVFVALISAALLSDLWTCLPLALIAAACRSGLPRAGKRLSPQSLKWIERCAYALFMIVAISRLARVGFNSVAYDSLMGYPHSTMVSLASEPAVTGIAASLIAFAEHRFRLSRRFSWRLLAISFPVAAFAFWIQQAVALLPQGRPDWAAALKRELPSGTTVYWDSGAEPTWVLLGRATYASLEQGASALFARQPAIELDRRLLRLESLGFIPTRLAAQGLKTPSKRVVTLTEVQVLCQDPILDLVLLNGSKAGATQIFHQASQTVSIFECAGFRDRSSGAL